MAWKNGAVARQSRLGAMTLAAVFGPAGLPLFFTIAACGGGGPPTPDGERHVASPFQAQGGRGVECPTRGIPVPSWALLPEAPKPSASSLTGSWVPVAADAAPGAVVRDLPCYEGIVVLALVQSASRLDAVWVIQGATSGPVPVGGSNYAEFATGTASGEGWRLEGVTIESSSVDGAQVAQCHAKTSELRYAPESGHLTGTREGVAVRYAPVVFNRPDDRREPCGPPPQ